MKEATQRIREQDLDFTIPSSDILEIDDVLQSMRDMKSALQAALQAQWRQEQARREQLASLTHDIQTPVTIIRGNAELLSQRATDESALKFAGYILQGALRIENYIAVLNRLADDEIDDVAFACVDAEGLIGDMSAELASLCAVKSITAAVRCDVERQRVQADRQLLLRAVSNVMNNAVYYTPAGGAVTLVATVDDSFLSLRIEDGGPGFTPLALREAAQRVFSERQGDAHAHGMGLYTARNIVLQHGGALAVGNAPGDEPHGVVEIKSPVVK